MTLDKGTFLGPYKILEKIGSGGMGEVYKAIDPRLERIVAIKILPSELAQNEEIRNRFTREARVLAAFTHPNIVEIYDIGVQDDLWYLVMEYVKGKTLREIIQVGKTDIQTSIQIALGLAQGLAEAHANGIIHRDLKPENIIVTETGLAKILDFGIHRRQTRHVDKIFSARTEALQTQPGVILGTLPYMSPEQIQGIPVTSSSDIFSFGIILHELFSGQRPFHGKSSIALMTAILNEKPPPLTHIPAKLQKIICQCLEKEPSLRPGADEIVHHLRMMTLSAPSKLTLPLNVLKPSFFVIGFLGLVFIILTIIISKPIWFPRQVPSHPSTSQIPEWYHSLAVLPFRNLSGDPNQDFFCDGLTEQLIAELSHLPALKVIAHTTMMSYKNTNKDVRQIGKELNVEAILEGSVQKSDQHIRIRMNLVSTQDGTTRWSRKFDTTLDDIFRVQDEITKATASELQVKYGALTTRRIETTRPDSVKAYEYYLKSNYIIDTLYVRSHKEEDFNQAVNYARKALSISPNYGLAYIALAYAYEMHYQVTGNPEDRAQQEFMIEKAYEKAPSLPEANSAMAYVRVLKKQYNEAYPYIRKALALNLNSYTTLHLAGVFSSYIGLYPQAIQFYKQAIMVNPLAYPSYANLAINSIFLGELENAQDYLEKALSINPNYPPLLEIQFLLSMFQHDLKRAKEFSVRIEEISPKTPAVQRSLAYFWAYSNEPDKAIKYMRTSDIYAILGQKKIALRELEQEIKRGSPYTTYLSLLHYPPFESLRDEPGFTKLLQQQKIQHDINESRYRLP